MLKYLNTEVTFAEVPDEITLCINITGCQNKCKGCHSPYLWKDIGEELTPESLDNLIKRNNGISCVSFMGGDHDIVNIVLLAFYVKNIYPDIKVCWYSGKDYLSKTEILDNFDYIKIGSYKEEYGGLDNPKTNQRMYKIVNGKMIDITSRFWKH